MLSDIQVTCSPHISKRISTRSVMLDVIIALLPTVICAGYFFKMYALILIATCVVSCMVSEWLCNLMMKRPNSLGDFSAVLTGIILALSVPPSLPWWAAMIGSAFAIVIGKMVYGGLGANIFNPAMAGRAFITLSFGFLISTWTVPASLDATMPDIGPQSESVDARTQATPLALSKDAIKGKIESQTVNRLIKAAFIGEVGGCLGETSSLAILIGGIYLLVRRTITWHIPVTVLGGAFVFATIFYVFDPKVQVWPIMHILTGGLMFGAFFIASDPVTMPVTRRGMAIFGLGVGIITMLIRLLGEYPEGVMFAVLLMNSVTPLIDRFCRRIPFGGVPNNE